MNWTSPDSFTWMLGAAVIAALYLIRGARRRKATATMFLWRRALAKRSAWRRFRPWVSAIWRSLIAILLALAMASPSTGPLQTAARSFVFVLDATASMRATDVEPSRFARAKTEIQALLDNLGPNDQAAIIILATEPYVAQRFTGSVELLRGAVEQTQCTDATGNVERAVAMAEQIVREQENSRVLVFTDRQSTNADSDLAERRVISGQSNNIALTSISARQLQSSSEPGFEVVVHVRALDAGAKNVNLQWLLNDQMVAAGRVELVDGSGFALRRFSESGLVKVSLVDAQDSLPTDNQMAIELRKRHDAAPWFGLATTANVSKRIAGAGELRSPSAKSHPIGADERVMGPLQEHGLWTWQPESGEGQSWYANLASPAESQLSVGVAGKPLAIAPGEQPPTPRHGWFLGLALLAWAAEWVAFALGVTE